MYDNGYYLYTVIVYITKGLRHVNNDLNLKILTHAVKCQICTLYFET